MRLLRLSVLIPVLAAAALIVVLILFINSSQDATDDETASDPVIVESATSPEGLVLALELPKTKWSTTEPVSVDVSLTNNGPEAVTLNYPTGQRFDVTIIGAGDKEVFRWSEGQIFRQVLGSVTLGPAESISENLVWTTEGDGGDKRRYSGTYILVAESSANSLKGMTVEHDITLE